MNELERLLAGTTGHSGGSVPRASTEDAGDRAMQRLRATLASRAQQLNLLDVAYRTIDTPVGQLLLAATPAGLVRVAHTRGDYDAVLTALAGQISPRVLFAPGRLEDAARQLDDYFARRRRSLDLPIDLRLSRGFRRTVLEHLPEVGYGRTVSYGELAAQVGSPRAARAVGSACATNPLPLVIPCHRVVLGDGSPGGYIGGPNVKRVLLNLERAQ